MMQKVICSWYGLLEIILLRNIFESKKRMLWSGFKNKGYNLIKCPWICWNSITDAVYECILMVTWIALIESL